jgi:proteasome lid subunit RPN8/RPN11
MTPFPKVSKWRVPEDLLLESLKEMSLDGENGNEGICLWLGLRNEAEEMATISHVVKLRGSGVIKSPAQIQIKPELMREVHEAAYNAGTILIGQIHSHGTEYGVRLSYVDVRYGIAIPYYLSVVAPHYALRFETNWQECGVHVYLPNRGYSLAEASKIIVVDKRLSLTTLTINNE